MNDHARPSLSISARYSSRSCVPHIRLLRRSTMSETLSQIPKIPTHASVIVTAAGSQRAGPPRSGAPTRRWSCSRPIEPTRAIARSSSASSSIKVPVKSTLAVSLLITLGIKHNWQSQEPDCDNVVVAAARRASSVSSGGSHWVAARPAPARRKKSKFTLEQLLEGLTVQINEVSMAPPLTTARYAWSARRRDHDA